MDTNKPQTNDVAGVAIWKFGAPPDIVSYMWIEAETAGETFGSATFVGSNATVLLEYVDETTYGTLRIGWDEARRVAAYSWTPSAK